MTNSKAQVPPGDVDGFYNFYYQSVFGSGIAGKSLTRTHERLERPFAPSCHLSRVLEPGAGQGEHFRFVRHGFDEYVELDVRPNVRPKVQDPRIVRVIGDAQRLEYDDGVFDRVVATCLLLHLTDPEAALSEWRRVTRAGGYVSLHVPCDPGVLVRLARSVITVPRVRQAGFRGYRLFNARDHRNHVGAIDSLVHFVFRNDELRVHRYPFGIPSWNVNAFYTYQVEIRK